MDFSSVSFGLIMLVQNDRCSLEDITQTMGVSPTRYKKVSDKYLPDHYAWIHMRKIGSPGDAEKEIREILPVVKSHHAFLMRTATEVYLKLALTSSSALVEFSLSPELLEEIANCGIELQLSFFSIGEPE